MSWKPKSLHLMSFNGLLDEFLATKPDGKKNIKMNEYHKAVRLEIIERFRLAGGA